MCRIDGDVLFTVRKAILASVPMSISRRSRQGGGFSSSHAYSGGRGGGGNSMMKQTMKMARQRLVSTQCFCSNTVVPL